MARAPEPEPAQDMIEFFDDQTELDKFKAHNEACNKTMVALQEATKKDPNAFDDYFTKFFEIMSYDEIV